MQLTPLNKGHLATYTRGTFSFPILILYNDHPLTKDTSIKRTSLLVPMVSVIEVIPLYTLIFYHRLQNGNPHVHVRINNQSEVSLLVHTEKPLPIANTSNSSFVR